MITESPAIHIFDLANRLVEYGVDCAVAVPRDKFTIRALDDAKFTYWEFDELNAGISPFQDGRVPNLLHAWTPREVVRRETERLSWRDGCFYVVHIGDNEEVIFAALNISSAQQRRMTIEELDERIGASMSLSHPFRYRR
jgi:hypothetical protein